MAAQARVKVLNEAAIGADGSWKLCFQYCRYEYEDDTEENGYRFILRRPNGNMQGARGQARIPSIAEIMRLTAIAIEEGWGDHVEDKTGHGEEE